MLKNTFKPQHINATSEDLAGNDGIGRYIFLPGSNGRAKEIANHFEKVSVKPHPREHNLYLGTLKIGRKKIDVASIATGMGCPSMEIILHELFNLGAKRFLRIGSAGTLQPGLVHVGDLVNVHASVRDENTTCSYAPIEVPAIASLEMVSSVLLASEATQLHGKLHTGTVLCKSSLYGRELGIGPRTAENQAYLNLLSQLGVLAGEMETAALFIQSQLYNYQLMQEGDAARHRVLAGAILGIVGDTDYFEESDRVKTMMNDSILLGIETIKILAAQELIE